MNNNQYGQAAVEFAVSISLLIGLLLAIPIIGKIANANIMSIQALDYAAWRVREGNTENDKLSREVSDRYFGETALIVDHEQLNDSGANLGKGSNNQRIYLNDTASVNYIPDDSKMSSINSRHIWNKVNDTYHLDLYKKKGTVSINLPLENLDVIPEIASSLTITKSLYIDNQELAARDKDQINSNLNSFDNIIIPYNDGTQNKSLNIPTNVVIEGLKVLQINVFKNYKVKEISVKHDEVPDDRLVEFKP